MTNGRAEVRINIQDMDATKDLIQRAVNQAYQQGQRDARATRVQPALPVVFDDEKGDEPVGVHAQTNGADVELVEFCENPDDVKIVVPNAILINGQRTYLSADTPVSVEYEAVDDGVAIPIVTVRMQCRRLLIEARSETEAKVEDQPAETPEERWKRLDREYFDLVGKTVRIVEGSEPAGAIGIIDEYAPDNGAYKARFGINFTDPQGDYLGHRTYIREAFEVVQDV